jgi:hypothetical protein
MEKRVFSNLRKKDFLKIFMTDFSDTLLVVLKRTFGINGKNLVQL